MQSSFDDVDIEPTLDLDADALERLRGPGYLAVGSGVTGGDGARPDPKDVIHLHVSLERARRFLDDRLWDRAVAQLEAGLEQDPNNLAALMDLAAAQDGAGDLDQALETRKIALEMDPAYTRICVQMGSIEFRRGRAGLRNSAGRR